MRKSSRTAAQGLACGLAAATALLLSRAPVAAAPMVFPASYRLSITTHENTSPNAPGVPYAATITVESQHLNWGLLSSFHPVRSMTCHFGDGTSMTFDVPIGPLTHIVEHSFKSAGPKYFRIEEHVSNAEPYELLLEEGRVLIGPPAESNLSVSFSHVLAPPGTHVTAALDGLPAGVEALRINCVEDPSIYFEFTPDQPEDTATFPNPGTYSFVFADDGHAWTEEAVYKLPDIGTRIRITGSEGFQPAVSDIVPIETLNTPGNEWNVRLAGDAMYYLSDWTGSPRIRTAPLEGGIVGDPETVEFQNADYYVDGFVSAFEVSADGGVLLLEKHGLSDTPRLMLARRESGAANLFGAPYPPAIRGLEPWRIDQSPVLKFGSQLPAGADGFLRLSGELPHTATHFVEYYDVDGGGVRYAPDVSFLQFADEVPRWRTADGAVRVWQDHAGRVLASIQPPNAQSLYQSAASEDAATAFAWPLLEDDSTQRVELGFLNAAGTALYFTADRAATQGFMDIYRADLVTAPAEAAVSAVIGHLRGSRPLQLPRVDFNDDSVADSGDLPAAAALE